MWLISEKAASHGKPHIPSNANKWDWCRELWCKFFQHIFAGGLHFHRLHSCFPIELTRAVALQERDPRTGFKLYVPCQFWGIFTAIQELLLSKGMLMVDPTRSNGLSLRNTCIKLRRTWWLNKCWSSHSELPYAPPSKVNLSIVSFPVAPPKKMQFNKKLDTIVDPHKKHTIEDHGHSWIFFGLLNFLLWKNRLIFIPRRMKLSKRKKL